MGNYGSCDDLCYQHRQVQCVRNWNGLNVVAYDDKCDSKTRPPSRAMCGNLTWYVGDWSSCDDSCQQNRTVNCSLVCGRVIPQKPEKCKYLPMTQPVSAMACSSACKFEWVTGDWDDCDSKCSRHRDVTCQRVGTDKAVIVNDQLCDQTTKPISDDACGSFAFVIGPFSGCDSSCIANRSVQCNNTCAGNSHGVLKPSSVCAAKLNQTSPDSQKLCDNCTVSWAIGGWGSCVSNGTSSNGSVVCQQSRTVVCQANRVNSPLSGPSQVDDRFCLNVAALQPKPATQEPCSCGSSDGSNNTAIIAGTVGGVLGAAAVGGAAAYFIKKARTGANSTTIDDIDAGQNVNQNPLYNATPTQENPMYESDSFSSGGG